MRKPIQEFYPNAEQEGKYLWLNGDYNNLLQSFGYEILLKCDEDDYTGDSLVIFKDGGKYGFLCFGWGSCSGCDALQAVETWEDVEKLREEICHIIIWKDSLQEIKYYIKSAEELSNPHYIHNSIFSEFKQKLEDIK